MKLSALLFSALLLARTTFAATLAVLPGESIQAKVDLAAPGDIIAIFGGTYTQDVIVNKAIRLTEVDGEDVTITGNVTFTGITNAPPFEGIVVGSAGKGITITNTTGLVLKNIDARPGFGVVVNGTSKVGITGGFYSQISQDGGELTTTITQVTGSFNTTVNAVKTVAFRTSVGGPQNWNSKKAWIGYSSGTLFSFGGMNSNVVIVGTTFNGGGTQGNVVYFGGSLNKFSLTNSMVKDAAYGVYDINGPSQVYFGQACVAIASANEAFVANNYFRSVYQLSSAYTYHYTTLGYQGAGVFSVGSSAVVINNIFSGQWRGVSMPYGAISKNNFFNGVYSGVSGGVVDFESAAGDPLFVSGQIPNLQTASPCINAGINDPVFYDINGTRNDIGPGGGCLFDPVGWTTPNPVVISFDIAPLQLLKGVDTQVTLSKGQSVSQP